MQIELRPHKGVKETRLGNAVEKREVDFNQCYVIVNGKQVAWYCGKRNEPGKYLSFIRNLPDDLQKEIAAQVAKITGGVGVHNSPPPPEHDVVGDE